MILIDLREQSLGTILICLKRMKHLPASFKAKIELKAVAKRETKAQIKVVRHGKAQHTCFDQEQPYGTVIIALLDLTASKLSIAVQTLLLMVVNVGIECAIIVEWKLSDLVFLSTSPFPFSSLPV